GPPPKPHPRHRRALPVLRPRQNPPPLLTRRFCAPHVTSRTANPRCGGPVEPRQCHIVVHLTTAMSSLQESVGVKRGWPVVWRWWRGLPGRVAWAHGCFALAGALSCEPGGG